MLIDEMKRTELDTNRLKNLLRRFHEKIPLEALIWFQETIGRVHRKQRPFTKARLRLRGQGQNETGPVVDLNPTKQLLRLSIDDFEYDTSWSGGWSILGDFDHEPDEFDNVLELFGNCDTDVYIDFQYSEPVTGSRLRACPGPGSLRRIGNRLWKIKCAPPHLTQYPIAV